MKKFAAAVCLSMLCACAIAQDAVVSEGLPKVGTVDVYTHKVVSRSVTDTADVKYAPYANVTGAFMKNNEAVATFQTDANGYAKVEGITEGEFEMLLEDEATGIFSSERVVIVFDENGKEEVNLLLGDRGLIRLPDGFTGNTSTSVPSTTPQIVSQVPQAQQAPYPQYPYMAGSQQHGWWALAGLGGLAGLAGLSKPVSPASK